MTISLAGIIAVQYFWILNAISVREQQFDRSVNEVLTQVVQRLKKDREVHFVSDYILDDGQDYAYVVNDSVTWTSVRQPGDAPLIISSSKGKGSSSTVSINATHGNRFLSVEALHNDTLRYRTIVKLDSLRDRLDNDEYVVMTELRDSLDIMVNKTLSEVRNKRISVNKAIDEMVFELKSIDELPPDSVTRQQIDSRIRQGLTDKGIDMDYEFGIYIPEKDSLTDIRSAKFKLDEAHSYKTRLFPENIFERSDLLILSLTDWRIRILRSMAWLLAGSVLFTLVIIITFYITIRVILKQKKLSEIKSDFINNMTHEFKTPIATISLAVDSINNANVIENPEKIRYFTGVIGEENKRMNDRVENVLQMSLIDSGDFNLQPEPMDLHELVALASKHINLRVNNTDGSLLLGLEARDPVIVADRSHLMSILTNLLDNAIKYSSGKPEIRITTSDNDQWIWLEVSDMGIGMSKEEQNRIFDKFYRVPSGNIHNVKGFGLGLSYVKAIILSMKGDITVWSKPGQGTTFTIRLPRNKTAS